MMHSSVLPRALATGAALALSAAAAQAQGFSFSGDFSAGTGTLNVLADTTFTVTENSGFVIVIFDEAASLGSGSTDDIDSYFLGVQYSINGVNYSDPFAFIPRYGSGFGVERANDASMYAYRSVLAGSVVVFKQGSYTGAANANSNLAALEGVTVPQSYLASNSSPRISNIVVTAVPEPEEYAAIAAAGLVGFGLWRRSQRRA